jgi:hypothetical protein
MEHPKKKCISNEILRAKNEKSIVGYDGVTPAGSKKWRKKQLQAKAKKLNYLGGYLFLVLGQQFDCQYLVRISSQKKTL